MMYYLHISMPFSAIICNYKASYMYVSFDLKSIPFSVLVRRKSQLENTKGSVNTGRWPILRTQIGK